MTDNFFSSELFQKVQLSKLFIDSKTFADAMPLSSMDEIILKYDHEKHLPQFDLKKFVLSNFEIPALDPDEKQNVSQKDIKVHLNDLWDELIRKPAKSYYTLINLPQQYIVPGGRFREIYYWDSYFTMLGLQASGRYDLIESMIKNFAFLIDTIGYIPNGNRTYYVGRSQPPFFSLMVNLLREYSGDDILKQYLPQIKKEYDLWMTGATELTEDFACFKRVVKLPGGYILNRYWDDHETPRPEAYKEDYKLAEHSGDKKKLYRNIRAAAESGWDFSSRWFKDGSDFSTIHTTDILPVDLNCLLYYVEQTLETAYTLNGNHVNAQAMKNAYEMRAKAIENYFWVEADGFYFDYDVPATTNKKVSTLAAAFPLFFKLSNNAQASSIAKKIGKDFFRDGGLITTTIPSGQQWDAPNGWAPLQWISIMGLANYGERAMAENIANKWMALNEKVYKDTGKMMEKYNVMDINLEAGGGEYPAQDGFGWTNGVYLALDNWLHKQV
ncbi:MAG: alpha,alpha-trehalase TreF [Ginsengibacter sp.]